MPFLSCTESSSTHFGNGSLSEQLPQNFTVQQSLKHDRKLTEATMPLSMARRRSTVPESIIARKSIAKLRRTLLVRLHISLTFL